ncbi:YgfZ/GcvT domain-containing protein [Pseudomarimonas arenosa]|uniref:Folate-binding protein n=1 Tax=Pseudomarimonas arenosa TaxID=2774145 RepID=A0AAW3ZK19_9GAMM|nr:folate-binding protein [Pseudomarimonas arenosa]MBD8525265.1 folate-binding protein [Pseudomarimonas arenosa]
MIDAVYSLDVAAFPLPFDTVQISGADAADFLQRQLMNDVRQLRQAGDSQWTGMLTAKGKLIHLFLLLRLDDQRFAAICPDQDGAALISALQRLLFRSKLQIQAMPEAQTWFQPVVASARSGMTLSWDGQRSLTWFEHAPDLTPPDAAARAAAEAAWQLADLEAGIVRLQDANRDQFTPQMLGLNRRHAFSLNKGCYPGQEIVSRTHFLGKAKRGLQLLAHTGEVQCGDAILHQQREVGSVVSNSVNHQVLAVLPLEQPEPLSNPLAAFTYLSPTWSAG